MITTEKMEGTILLDGLIEGRLSDEAVEQKLRKWVEFMGTLGLRFNLDVGPSAFSILPDNQAVSTARLAPSPDDAIRQGIEQLIQVLPEKDRGSVFSTLRSAEFRRNEEVQSLYVIASAAGGGPAGVEVQVQSRSIDAKTVAPPRPVSVKEKVKLAVLGVVFAAVFFGIAMLFPAVRQKVGEFFGAIKPVTVDAVTVRSAAFENYFTATPKEFSQGSRVLIITLKATDAYPRTAEALDAAYAGADTLSKKLAVEALAKGYVRIELVDAEGVTFLSGEFRIRGLEQKGSIDLEVPVVAGEKKRRLERVEIRY